MKKNKRTRINDLFIDVVEYAFVEWLVRRNLYSAFRSNFERVYKSKKPFRDCLRDHIRLVNRNPSLGLGAIITAAFLFTSTPEGYDFWLKRSDAWRRFFAEFVKHR